MAVTVYRSTDTGAPALYTDSAGSLITILDACLVNGYGSQPPQARLKHLPALIKPRIV